MSDDLESTPINVKSKSGGKGPTPAVSAPLPKTGNSYSENDGASDFTEDLAVDDPEPVKEPENKEEYYKRSRNRDETIHQFFGEWKGHQRADVRCLRKALSEAFADENELRIFCQDYLQDTYRNLKDQDRFDVIVAKIIAHCESRGNLDFLWDWLARERSKIHEQHRECGDQYDKFEEFDRSHRNINIPTPDSASQTNGHPPQQDSASPHPLTTTDTNAIRTWFFDDLNQKEQSFVTTVALFEGANRKHIMALAEEIETLLFTPDPEAQGNNDHE